MNNHPDKLIYGDEVPNYADIGVRYKYMWNKHTLDEHADRTEIKDDVANFLV